MTGKRKKVEKRKTTRRRWRGGRKRNPQERRLWEKIVDHPEWEKRRVSLRPKMVKKPITRRASAVKGETKVPSGRKRGWGTTIDLSKKETRRERETMYGIRRQKVASRPPRQEWGRPSEGGALVGSRRKKRERIGGKKDTKLLKACSLTQKRKSEVTEDNEKIVVHVV